MVGSAEFITNGLGRRCLVAGVVVPVLLLGGTACGLVGSDDAAETDSQPGADEGGEGGGGGDGGEGEGDGDGDNGPLASTTSVWLEGDSRLDITSLERVDSETVVLHFELENTSEENIGFLTNLRGPSYDPNNSHSPTGVYLVDPAKNQAYFPWTTEEGTCFCTEYEETDIPPAETFGFWAAFPAPPDGVDEVSVGTPVTPPLHDIPITDGGEAPQDAPADLADPYVVDLRGREENTVSQTSRDESGGDVVVSLASDVLFELNEAELTDEANGELEKAAAEIDDADADVVQIDGHTDDSGDDDVNEPLSKDRAEAVEGALDDLVTRSGISYEVEGHGSADPVADNDTDEGAQKNRRVTVSFGK